MGKEYTGLAKEVELIGPKLVVITETMKSCQRAMAQIAAVKRRQKEVLLSSPSSLNGAVVGSHDHSSSADPDASRSGSVAVGQAQWMSGGSATSSSSSSVGSLGNGGAGAARRMSEQLKEHVACMTQAVAEASTLLNEITLQDRKLQHLMILADRAADVDMQCLSAQVPTTVVTSGSPLYPDVTLSDCRSVLDEAVSLCARASRVAQAIRKLVATAEAEANVTVDKLETVLETASRLHADVVDMATRHADGFKWELARVQRAHSKHESDLAAVTQRQEHVERMLGLRVAAESTLLSEKSGAPGSADPVIAALKREAHELALRKEEIRVKLASLESTLADLTMGVRSYSATASYGLGPVQPPHDGPGIQPD